MRSGSCRRPRPGQARASVARWSGREDPVHRPDGVAEARSCGRRERRSRACRRASVRIAPSRPDRASSRRRPTAKHASRRRRASPGESDDLVGHPRSGDDAPASSVSTSARTPLRSATDSTRNWSASTRSALRLVRRSIMGADRAPAGTSWPSFLRSVFQRPLRRGHAGDPGLDAHGLAERSRQRLEADLDDVVQDLAPLEDDVQVALRPARERLEEDRRELDVPGPDLRAPRAARPPRRSGPDPTGRSRTPRAPRPSAASRGRSGRSPPCRRAPCRRTDRGRARGPRSCGGRRSPRRPSRAR